MDEFEVTEDHITLLQLACVSWCDDEFGAPCIDPKRPYGNSSVYHDMVKILDIDPSDFTDRELQEGEIPAELANYLATLHAETKTALEIFLSTGEMSPGIYEREFKYERVWTKVEDFSWYRGEVDEQVVKAIVRLKAEGKL